MGTMTSAVTGAAAGAVAGAVAVLGIDPGRRWTAGVLRQEAEAVHGWTIGPVDASGRPSAAAADNVHDLAAWARYMARLIDVVEATLQQHRDAGGGPVRLACEVVLPPGGRIALADWLIPRQIVAGLLAYDPNLLLIRPDGHGKRHYDRDGSGRLVRARPVNANYPPAFWPAKGERGGRPASWGPCEARRGERDHERAAYDIAGAALAQLQPAQ
ncbi:hypothetical protein [Nonomuraea sp. B19D2]|uniref:hypothetical protein n=1 Tax=Nonomuraea sp. B19D2 TaxID=3159561 RepID=UPI0032DA51EF